MKTIIPAVLLASLAVTVSVYCAKAHADGYQNYGYHQYGYTPRVIGPGATGVQPGLSPGEFGALYILQQQQALDMQRQQLELMRQQQQQYNAEQRTRIMMDSFGP